MMASSPILSTTKVKNVVRFQDFYPIPIMNKLLDFIGAATRDLGVGHQFCILKN